MRQGIESVAVADLFQRARPVIIAGPCVVESFATCAQIAEFCAKTCAAYGLGYIFKASFDKANRTSVRGFRGPGPTEAKAVLAQVREQFALPVLTDIHLPQQAAELAAVVDVLQIPAFLCRQTDLLLAAAATGRPVNIKKGQFLAYDDMRHVVAKHRSVTGAGPVAVTERGSCFGYHDLVVDMRGLPAMRKLLDCPIVFDATHSVQRPGGGDGKSTGDRQLAPVLARAAAAVGIDGLFCEVHPNPDQALSDGPNSLDFTLFEQVCRQTRALCDVLATLSL